jgi:uncharacterized alpha-E superfamily protein
MIILNSNAQNIYWVGRYLSRIQHLCGQFPFQDDEQALKYAHAFCLPAFNASSLNELILSTDQSSSFHQQFEFVKNNIQDLRGVLSVKAYAELKLMIDTATKNAGLICTVVDESSEVLEAENEDIFLFFSLGQYSENLDREIRLELDINDTLKALSTVIDLLKKKGWDSLDAAWQHLLEHPSSKSFYQLNDQVQYLFEVDA